VRLFRARSDPTGREITRFEGGRVLNNTLPPLTAHTFNGHSLVGKTRLLVELVGLLNASPMPCAQQVQSHARRVQR
jgi:hypothetical protein